MQVLLRIREVMSERYLAYTKTANNRGPQFEDLMHFLGLKRAKSADNREKFCNLFIGRGYSKPVDNECRL